MDIARKGEIALLVLKQKLRKEGIQLGPNFKRDIGNTAKDIGIPLEEAMELAEELTREYVEETFTKAKKIERVFDPTNLYKKMMELVVSIEQYSGVGPDILECAHRLRELISAQKR